jgi:glycosyltransferase involved in cell wall biosynthesis
MRPFIPLAARRATAIIAVSEATKKDIVRILKVKASQVHVIHEAVSPVFRPLPPDDSLEEVRRAYNLPKRFLLYVGTIEPRKNLVRLIQAYHHLCQRQEHAHALVFVGSPGWKCDEVFATVERLSLNGKVRFLGYVPQADLVALYNLAEAMAFPSLYEGFGLPILEAMACGTPVIASPNGSLQEVAGSAAEFVDPKNVESIADGLQHVLSNPARQEELRAKGFAQAARFSWETTARQTLALYKQAVQRRDA